MTRQKKDGTGTLWEELEKDNGLSPGLTELLDQAANEAKSGVNRRTIIMNIYTANEMRKAVGDLIESNTQLSSASDRYAKSLNWLTGALVFVGGVQVITLIVSIFVR